MIRIDFTNPATFRKLAELPYYGYAEAIIRRIDPMWKADESRLWIVHLERGDAPCPHCGCDCNSDEPLERKKIEIEAASADEAQDEAEKLWPSWIAAHAEPAVKIATAEVPEKYMKWFEV